MTLQITLPPELEASLERHAAAAGQDVATFVQEVVRERLEEGWESGSVRRRSRDLREKLQRIIELHPISPGYVDDSRESIYAGRGE